MKWRVYYLYSEKLRKYYIGKTNDLSRRLNDHNRGKEKFTKKGIPWKLIGFINCDNNLESTRLETKLKKAKNKKYVR